MSTQGSYGKLFRIILGLILLVSAIGDGFAKIRLPALVGDRMVLQRDVEITIWGWADQGETITLKFLGELYHTMPDEEGKWEVEISPKKAGGPYIMEVNEIVIRDILIGDVWLGSGQSNMETPIARLTEKYPEIDVSNNNMIRYYKVPTQHSVVEKKEEIAAGGKWYSGTASDIMNWTALAYFYAQKAYEHTNVPQGMVIASLGGSAIESWVSQTHLKQFPELVIDEHAWRAVYDSNNTDVTKDWNAFDWNDKSWETIKVPGFWQENGIRMRGTVFYRKDFELADSLQGRYAKIILGTLVDSDSVFVNGHLVGTTAYMYPPRKYPIPAGILKAGRNNITIKLTANAGNGGFVPDKEYKIELDDFEIDLAGDWQYKIGVDLDEMNRYRQQLKNMKTVGSSLYNGMIFPLKNYKVRGAIWYQGEANAGDPANYKQLLTELINDWRLLFDAPEMPFLLVQLPNYLAKPTEPPLNSGWARIRGAQLNVAKEIPHTALAVTYDVGEWNDIHPLNKKDVAHRLFLGARKVVYGEEVVSSGPIYKGMKIKNDKIEIYFSELTGGLQSRGGQLKHFAIAGEDRTFVWADAVIKGNTVVVSCPNVKNPVAVRYAWSDNPEDANLINKEGLLASPFRTDEW
ncbi:sialate O-acetylesterase [Sphingobacterium corticibacterium]|uniref:Sialate O-acetylesterase n=1 Tax=Sphingobacterium corticibacterium TaxID=2484746 RepID=A0A4Q6XPH3_9SPHI|nr:sialate O-acetylesterase [Sphingobacterium corticibacterium]RZF59292.1 sialate O-acetylesterase [Sphingobacterium corticibacterium]